MYLTVLCNTILKKIELILWELILCQVDLVDSVGVDLEGGYPLYYL